jgi:DGQHR domain-containing protein
MSPSHQPSYPALALSQNKQRFFFSTIPVEDLFPSCFVARRDEDPSEGFQRALTESRADDISRYLAEGTGSIPTNVVLSAQPEAKFAYNSRAKTISFARIPKAFLVLDGQHRLWGYHKCPTKHRVPVAVYEGLSRTEETKLFIDINTNQRGVPAVLLLDIKHLANMESVKEGTKRNLFDRLQADSNSPLKGKLSPAKSVAGKISRVTFNRAMEGALNSPVVQSMSPDDRYKLIRNYISAFEAELLLKSTLIKAAFFEAIFEMFDEIVRATMVSHKNVKQSSLQETLRVVAKLDYSARGKLTKKSYTDIMQAAFRQSDVAISSEML